METMVWHVTLYESQTLKLDYKEAEKEEYLNYCVGEDPEKTVNNQENKLMGH